jgi:phosphatidate cytidylyltransferase
MVIAQGWPLRIGLAGCFALAAAEVLISAYRRKDWSAKTAEVLMPRYFTVAVALCAAIAVLVKPLSVREMLAVIIVTFTADIGGYFIGKRYGRRKLPELRQISPNKTVEGYMGGLVASWVLGGLFILFSGMSVSGLAKFWLWLLGGLMAFIGDLLASMTKRGLSLTEADDLTRDMPVIGVAERLMKGHGGYLDRFDSLGLTFCFYYLIIYSL